MNKYLIPSSLVMVLTLVLLLLDVLGKVSLTSGPFPFLIPVLALLSGVLIADQMQLKVNSPWFLLAVTLFSILFITLQHDFFLYIILFSLAILHVAQEGNQNKCVLHPRKFRLILVGFVVLFVAIRFYLMVVSGGSYIDEYYHLISASELINNGSFSQFYDGSVPYIRGLPVTLSVTVLYFFLPVGPVIAKIIPFACGLLSLLFFYLSGHILMGRSKSLLLGILVMAIFPWILFSHQYIRMYVFYEVLVLFSTYLFLRFWKSNDRKFAYLLILITVATPLVFFDQGALLVTLFTILLLCGVFVVKPGSLFSGLNLIPQYVRVGILIVISLAMMLFPAIRDQAKHFFFGSLQNSVPSTNPFVLLTLICLLGIIPLLLRAFFIGENNLRILSAAGGGIFLLHLGSSSELQVIRVIMYLIPVLLLIGMAALSHYEKKEIIWWASAALILVGALACYPSGFFSTPHIPDEVNFAAYPESAIFVKEHCPERVVALVHNPYIYSFYGIDDLETAYIRRSLLQEDIRFTDKGSYVSTAYGNITAHTNEGYLSELNFSASCIILPENYESAWRYISEYNFHNLQKRYSVKHFNGVTVLYP